MKIFILILINISCYAYAYAGNYIELKKEGITVVCQDCIIDWNNINTYAVNLNGNHCSLNASVTNNLYTFVISQKGKSQEQKIIINRNPLKVIINEPDFSVKGIHKK